MPRPLCGWLSTATRLLIRLPVGELRRNPLAQVLLDAVHLKGRQQLPVGQLRQAGFSPLTPMNDSTWSYHGSMSL